MKGRSWGLIRESRSQICVLMDSIWTTYRTFLYILFIHFLSTMMSTALIGQIPPPHDEMKPQEPLIKTNASVLSSFLLVFCQSDEKSY